MVVHVQYLRPGYASIDCFVRLLRSFLCNLGLERDTGHTVVAYAFIIACGTLFCRLIVYTPTSLPKFVFSHIQFNIGGCCTRLHG